jgi:glycosyltransferase involved in cell wall biosynthesis
MPAVSVVIPSYRGGAYLRESVESVREQTLQDWEVIVVADGCEEDMSDLEQSDSRVRLLKQRHRGESIARNVGIASAEAEFVALLDDDDRMLPGRLLAQLEAMQQDDEVGLCHTQIRTINAEGAVIGSGSSRETQYRDCLRTDGQVKISSTMIRKSLIQAVGGFNPLLPIGQDLDLVYRIARESKIRFLPEVFTEYRVHGNNIWSNTSKSSGEEIKSILSQHRMLAQARGETDNVRAIDEGMKHVLPSRAQFALERALTAHNNRDFPNLLGAAAQALVISPVVVLRVVIRSWRNQQWRRDDG